MLKNTRKAEHTDALVTEAFKWMASGRRSASLF